MIKRGKDLPLSAKKKKVRYYLSFKKECIYRHKSKTLAEAKMLIDNYFYNHERIQLKSGLAPLALRQSA